MVVHNDNYKLSNQNLEQFVIKKCVKGRVDKLKIE